MARKREVFRWAKATAVTAALALACALPCPALAAEPSVEGVDAVGAGGTAETQFSVVAGEGWAQLDVTVPARVVLAFEDDGSLTAPTGARFENGSAAPVDVMAAEAVASRGFTVVGSDAMESVLPYGSAYVAMDVKAHGAEGVPLSRMVGGTGLEGWRMEAEGSEGDTLPLSFEDAMTQRALPYAKSAAKAFDVTWTVAIDDARA